QHDDPLRSRILMPVSHPADRLHGVDDGRIGALLLVVPLRSGAAHSLQLELGQGASGLVADAVGVDPQMPIRYLWLWARVVSHAPSPPSPGRCPPIFAELSRPGPLG